MVADLRAIVSRTRRWNSPARSDLVARTQIDSEFSLGHLSNCPTAQLDCRCCANSAQRFGQVTFVRLMCCFFLLRSTFILSLSRRHNVKRTHYLFIYLPFAGTCLLLLLLVAQLAAGMSLQFRRLRRVALQAGETVLLLCANSARFLLLSQTENSKDKTRSKLESES